MNYLNAFILGEFDQKSLNIAAFLNGGMYNWLQKEEKEKT